MDNLQKRIEDALEGFDFTVFIRKMKHAKTQPEKRRNVKENLQTPLNEHFQIFLPDFVWSTEEKINPGKESEDIKDSVDIYAKKENVKILLELDAWRADQVAKKMMSRFSYIVQSDAEFIAYVALCYPGTKNMNLNECKKYLGYGQNVICHVGKKTLFIAAVISKSGEIEILNRV